MPCVSAVSDVNQRKYTVPLTIKPELIILCEYFSVQKYVSHVSAKIFAYWVNHDISIWIYTFFFSLRANIFYLSSLCNWNKNN